MDALVAHYHEVSLKGRNRAFFEETLTRNLKRALRGTGYDGVRRGFGRIVVDFSPEANLPEAVARAARVPGIAYVGLGRRTEQDVDAAFDAALELLADEPFDSFAVRARRSYARVATKSGRINEIVGRRIVEATGKRVDLKHPDATIYIEMFGKTCIVYRNKTAGPGGLPSGVSGRMLALISGGIDSPVAAYRMILRGAELEFVHFHGMPYTDPSSVRQVNDLVQVLVGHQLRCTVHLVPLGDAQRAIVMNAPAHLRVILYRRAMMRMAAALAEQRDAIGLVTGDSLGQVASQTIENIRTVDAAVPGIQVLRPLIGMDKLEIIDLAQHIGTYDISIRKYQDCCVLFEPRAPATRANPGLAEGAEDNLDVDELVGKALAGLETHVIELPPLEVPAFGS